MQQGFEFWRLNRFRIRVQPGYNSYNQSYNTINLDAVAAMQIWTASDPSTNENISGVTIKSYNNAKVHTVSFNSIKTVVNTRSRINQQSLTPRTILPAGSWLDTSVDISDSNVYSGAQFFAQMNGVTGVNYVPTLQLIFEYDVEFKLPAYQNRPSAFESDIIGAKLITQPDSSTEDTRVYKCVSYSINGTGMDYRFEREDGEPGSLNFDQEEMWEVYVYRNSGQYFSGRPADYIGPIPRKPVGWTPSDQ